MTKWLATMGMALGVVALTACGDSSSSSGGGGESGEGTDTGLVGTTAPQGTSTTTTSTSTGAGGGSQGGECASKFAAQGANQACADCTMQNCATEAKACCDAAGCTDVINCAAEKKCTGLDCYQDATCKTQIDAAGGPTGAGVAAAQEFGTCVLDPMKGKCSMECSGIAGAGGSK